MAQDYERDILTNKEHKKYYRYCVYVSVPEHVKRVSMMRKRSSNEAINSDSCSVM